MQEFVKFSVPEELRNLQMDTLTKISKSGKLKIGINEVTKAIERSTAKLVVLAQDISPAEIVMHIPVICKEKNIPFTYIQTREELGKLAGISAKASAVAVVDEGVLKKEFSSLLSKIEEISGGASAKPKPEEKKTPEKKPVEKKQPAKKDVQEKKSTEEKKE